LQILSHRGYWKTPDEKNSPAAFTRSFELGFGTETDFRDARGRLVISHDPPPDERDQPALEAADFFELYRRTDRSVQLALNIKSDGLQKLLPPLLKQFGITSAFVFDMAVPDALGWLRAGVPTFTRQSELERDPAFYDQAAGIWLDAFYGDWWTPDVIAGHLTAGKQVCIVSPELHGRDPSDAWNRLAAATFRDDPRLMICTDYPEQAKEMLGG
jgi:glycerophosphoryl diester phosphodiesterase